MAGNEEAKRAGCASGTQVTGVLWGTDNPMAIINGGMYMGGSLIGDTQAKIHKIENNQITVLYKTQLFTVTTAKQ